MGRVAGKEPDYGPTAKTVAKNIADLRGLQNLNYTQLSTQLGRLGWPLTPAAVRRVEDCERRVTVDDLVALAVALGVSPASLLMPMRNADDTEVQFSDLIPITGWSKPITASVVWEWLGGSKPLFQGTLTSFARYAWPSWIRERFERAVAEAAVEMPVNFRFPNSDDSHGDDQ